MFVTVVLAAVGLLLGQSLASDVDPNAATQLTALADTTRQTAGLAPFTVSTELADHACIWAQHLADTGVVDHDPDLFAHGGGLSVPWSKIGETVGIGGDVTALHASFATGDGGPTNFVDPEFDTFGVCVRSTSDGQLVVVERFAALVSAPVTHAPAPSAAPSAAPATTPAPPAVTATTTAVTTPSAPPFVVTSTQPPTTGRPASSVTAPSTTVAPAAPSDGSRSSTTAAAPTSTSHPPVPSRAAPAATTTHVRAGSPVTVHAVPTPARQATSSSSGAAATVAGVLAVVCAAVGVALLTRRH